MKKQILLALALISVAYTAQAQYEKGDVSLNLGASFGLIGYGYGYYGSGSGFIPITISGEYSLNEQFGVGAYAGYFSRSYGSGDFRFTALSFGARGIFHAGPLLRDKAGWDLSEKLGLYAALLLGVETMSWKYRDDNLSGYYNNGSRMIFGPTVGVRYFFSPRFAGFFEAGRGAYGIGTIGITAKL